MEWKESDGIEKEQNYRLLENYFFFHIYCYVSLLQLIQKKVTG